MTRIVLPALLLLLIVPSGGAQEGSPNRVRAQGTETPEADALEIEWRARRWALDPESHREEIASALAAEQWTRVHRALDALGRTRESASWGLALLAPVVDGGDPPPPEGLLSHPHPNVRARALDLCTAAGRALDPEGPLAQTLATDPFDRVRRALARHLGLTGEAGSVAGLLSRLGAEDGEAGREARRLLMSSGAAAWRGQLELLRSDPRGLEAALLDNLGDLRRAPVSAELVAGLRASAEGNTAARVLAEGLALHGELDGEPGPAGVRADRSLLVAGWFAVGEGPAPDPDGLLVARLRRGTRAARLELAREGDPELGRALLECALQLAACELAPVGPARDRALAAMDHPQHPDQIEDLFGDRGEGVSFLLECATAALPIRDVLLAARSLKDGPGAERAEDLLEGIWSQVGEAGEGLREPGAWVGLETYLAPSRPRSLRWTAAGVLAEAYGEGGLVGTRAEDLLFSLLDDWDRNMRARAFRWLCSAPGVQDRLEELHRRWKGWELSERLLHLRSLPRDQPVQPFLADLLELCSRPMRRTAPVLELFAPFRHRPEVRAALEGWLDEALISLEAATDPSTYRAAEWRGKAIALALGEGAVPVLADALKRAVASSPARGFFPPEDGPHDPELAKTLAGLLAEGPQGREALTGFLGRNVPRRVRVEAAIGVARPGATARAAEVLRADYTGCDVDLGMRVLEALGRSGTPRSEAFLVGVAVDRRDALERRLAAVDALAKSTVLINVLERAAHPEVILTAAAHLGLRGQAGDADAGEGLARALAAVERRLGTERERQEDGQVGAELLLACLRAGVGQGVLETRGFAASVKAAGEDLAERFEGKRPAATGFRYRLDLSLARILAQRGRLGPALEAAGTWWRLDGRLLYELAGIAAASGDRELELRLIRAAEVSLAGEPLAMDTAVYRDRVLFLAYRGAVQREDWPEVAFRARQLSVDTRLRGVRTPIFEQALGLFDRRAGSDPFADLAAARWQARAWCALSRGDRAEARALAIRARDQLGASSRARRAQVDLENSLEF